MAAPQQSARARTGSGRKGPAHTWQDVPLAPVVLVQGAESLLVDRALARLVDLAREGDPDLEVVDLQAAAYSAGSLAVLTSPSLFGEAKLVIVRDAQACTDELIADVVDYVRAPSPDAHLLVAHGGGQRGKRMLDALRASGAPVAACEPLKRDADKAAFVAEEFRVLSRRADREAVQALVEALGSDLRELAAACAQLAADTTGGITAQVVARYYGGRVEATAFRVADAALAGEPGQAVSLLRHALSTGVDPVPLVAALAVKLRTLARVAALRGAGAPSAADLGLAPWQVDRARRELSRWTPEGLARAISAVAQADAEVKGAGRDPVYAIERAVLLVAGATRD